ncbi:MAG: glutamine synthetase [Lentisphaerae bacterium]|nr:glutamine synthetase [Lentisphaerota bacterium]
MEVQFYYPESGPGQHEISIKNTDPLTAADNQILYRETVRNIAERHWLKASFAPKPIKDAPGNGCHIHLSLWDEKNKTNLFYNAEDKHLLSSLGYNFTGGILKHTPALLAVTAPSVNSYRRLKPFCWSSAFTCWGPENREATVRLIQPVDESEKSGINLEYKPADPSMNPYLALGSLIAAGLDGIKNQILPGKPVLCDPATLSDEQRRNLNIKRYPETLSESLDEFEKDELFKTAFGDDLFKVFTAGRRSEAELFSQKDDDFEIANHKFIY